MSSPETKFESLDLEVLGIGQLIYQSDKLSVPIYQRAYAWEEKHITDLFEDIKEAINEGSSEYFLGTIVLSTKKQNNIELIEIIDGQQRITSIVILLSCIRDWFLKNNKEEISSNIKNDYISSYDIDEEKNLPKLILSETDNNFFERYIVNEANSETPIKISHKRIEFAKKFFESRLKELNIDILKKWIHFIKETLKIISIKVPSQTNAFTIFETLNDRGLELAQVDLLKNFLYSKANQKLNEIKYSWIEIISKIESAKDENLVLTYIKHYWSSQYGLTREKNKELYTKIQKEINNPSDVVSFVTSLKQDTDFYLAILNHNHDYWKNKPQEKIYIETLNFFQLEQFRPLLLSILKNFQELEIKKSLKIIVSWLVRNLITGQLRGGTLEKEYANKAKKVFNGEIKNTRQLKDDLKNLIPSDSIFKEKFIFATVGKEKYARYYLSSIENQLNSSERSISFYNLIEVFFKHRF